ncbi:hypothetical protein C2D64_08665 [Listeria ivanovii]|uniref:hypothetical protein n=1 Tax=Listeria ivanovii TaxID=1638 RepID=UPI000DAAD19A|nr:hypothetical protein [Listeria ivanovii]PZG33406.1 hypothetical protein C2D64_08665 [Listeria ivanovii]PZG45863.1 hypothetical protein C2D66_12280 [Listeria ivanovii]PZH11057.1 hypothetical protein C2D65_08615 [Listeria ivanovii]
MENQKQTIDYFEIKGIAKFRNKLHKAYRNLTFPGLDFPYCVPEKEYNYIYFPLDSFENTKEGNRILSALLLDKEKDIYFHSDVFGMFLTSWILLGKLKIKSVNEWDGVFSENITIKGSKNPINLVDISPTLFLIDGSILIKFDSSSHLVIIGLTNKKDSSKIEQMNSVIQLSKDEVVDYFIKKDAADESEAEDFKEAYFKKYYLLSI